jgi:hypothetical protein
MKKTKSFLGLILMLSVFGCQKAELPQPDTINATQKHVKEPKTHAKFWKVRYEITGDPNSRIGVFILNRFDEIEQIGDLDVDAGTDTFMPLPWSHKVKFSKDRPHSLSLGIYFRSVLVGFYTSRIYVDDVVVAEKTSQFAIEPSLVYELK